jgi:hypothetical protein
MSIKEDLLRDDELITCCIEGAKASTLKLFEYFDCGHNQGASRVDQFRLGIDC